MYDLVFSGGMMLLALVSLAYLPVLALYLLAPAPNRILSSIFSMFIWIIALIMLIFGIAGFLDQLLSSFGLYKAPMYMMADFSNDKTADFTWSMPALRLQIVLILIGAKLVWVMKKYFKGTIFDTEKDEKKSPTLFVSQLFHIKLAGLFLGIGIVLGYITGDFLLSLIPLADNKMGDFKDFVVNFFSLLIPYLLLFIVLCPSFMKKKRFMPQIKSPTYNILHTILMATVIAVGVIIIGLITHELLSDLIHGTNFSKNDIRIGLIGVLLSGGSFAILWQKCGGKKAFLKTK